MIIVDVREPHELEEVHIEGAISLPLSQISELSAEFFSKHTGEKLTVLCRSGARSQRAIDYWLEQSLIAPELVENYRGGIIRWEREGNPVVRG